MDYLFPSPCGVLVLKFVDTLNDKQFGVLCFRPLAGFWFLNTTQDWESPTA